MRIQTVIAELGVGGAEVVAVTLATAAAADGHEVGIASGPGFRIPQVRGAGVSHLPITMVGRNPVDLARSVLRLRASGRPDLVHAHNPKATLVARLAFGRDLPIVTTLHGVADAETAHAARILAWASDRVVVVSSYVGQQLARAGYPEHRIEVIPNAVQPLPPYPRAQARAELGIPPTAVVGLCLARMVDQKRHDLLVDAWSYIGQRAQLLLAGDGPNRARVAAAIDYHRLGGTVLQLGERADVPRLVAASDFLVLPTDWEGLPISVLEAMEAGLPVVASRVGGLAEHFAGAARLVEPGSLSELVTALDEVIARPALRAHLAHAGRARAAERFSADAMVQQYADLYARLAPTGKDLTATGARR
jgi:glycosyltransferase involved in cell wall biosynthesis